MERCRPRWACDVAVAAGCGANWFLVIEEMVRVQTGTVRWFDAAKGFGFVAPDNGGAAVFVEFTAIEGEGFRTLREGEPVRYRTARDRRGLYAVWVTPTFDIVPAVTPVHRTRSEDVALPTVSEPAA